MTDLSREEAERLARETVIPVIADDGLAHLVADLLQRTVNVKCAEAKVEEAEWWEHLAPDCNMPPSGNPECMYCQRITQLQRELTEACEKAKE